MTDKSRIKGLEGLAAYGLRGDLDRKTSGWERLD